MLHSNNAITRLHPTTKTVIPDLSRFGFVLTSTGMLAQNDPPTFEQWKACGTWLQQSEKALSSRLQMIQFAIGDWLNYGEKYFKNYREAAKITGFDDGTLRNFAYVARRFELSSRNYAVPFKHYQIAAPRKDRNEWLQHASEENWSADYLRTRIHESTQKPTHEPIEGIPQSAAPPPDDDEVEGKYNHANYGEQLHILLLDCAGAFRSIQAKSSDADIREICVAMRERIDDLLAEL